MTLVDNTLEDYGPDGKEWAMTVAGYNHVESVIHQAYHGSSPVGGLVWHGHAVREAFVAGAEWQKSRILAAIDTAPDPRVEALVDALQVVYGVLQAESTRSGGEPFTGVWSMPAIGRRVTVSDALDEANAALAAWKGGAA